MPVGRRERNKEEKRDRILKAAAELFSTRGVDDVTTQEIADAADIGSGTLFLYAKTKGELLLMVQNSHYQAALAEGVVAAESETSPTGAVMAIVSPIVICNRAHVGNGRTYLREMAFGDPTEPHHVSALEIVADTEMHVAQALQRTTHADAETAASLARVVSSLLLRHLAPPEELSGSVTTISQNVRHDVDVIVSSTTKSF